MKKVLVVLAEGFEEIEAVAPIDVLRFDDTVYRLLGSNLEALTTEPGIQLYTANFLDGSTFPKHGGFCLETQWFPDSVNVGHFPSSILRPGGTYHHKTVHRFS